MVRKNERSGGVISGLCFLLLSFFAPNVLAEVVSFDSVPVELQSTDAKDSRFADLPGLKRREMKLPSGERKRDELFLGSAADFPGRFEGELLRRERIVRTSERYPYIRVEEILEMGNGGENRVLQTRAIAADHVMILVDEREKDAVLAVCEDLGMKLRRWLPQSSILLVETSDLSLDGVDDAIDALRSRLGNWITVEADQVFFPAGELVPNDPSWGAQWNLDRIEAPSAWGATTGSKEVVVAIVDTGARLDHLDLVANLWRNPGETLDGTDNDGNGYIDDVHGYDFLLDQPLAVNNDTFNHGTHVAGIVGAVGNNEEGIAGVSWDVSLLILRAGEETFLESALIEAIDYATALRRDQGVRIVASNHSYGGQGDPVRMTATKSAIARHRDAGILFVAAAGNEGEDNDILATWPANYDLTDYPSVGDWNNVISVAASNRTDGKASFSNYGVETVHLAAPGARILSTSADRGNNGYATFSGTSMAAPHVTGAAALVQAANWGLDGEAIRKILLGSVDILPQWEEISTTGGRLNLGKAVAEARRYPDVRIASPVGPLFLGEGSDLVIIAEAQVEGEGEVTHVAFYANGLPIGIAGEGASGWSTTWEQIPSGAFVLTAVASADWDGVTRTMISEPVHVTVGGIEVDDAQADSVVVSAGWRSEVFDDAMGGTSHLFFRPRQTTGPPHNRHPGGADGHESFRFNADLPDDGEWKVEMWWPKYPDAYEETPIEIFHKEGSTALVLNQREGYGRWNDLGTYRFSPGVAGVVVKTVERQNYMLADAVRFSRLQAGPLVSVVATGPIADFDVGPGSFTLTRTRAEGVLDVGFALTGEAVEGEEYEAVEKWIQFDEGAHTASLSIVPLEEPGFTGEKSIVLELLEGADYRLTAPQKATIFLVAELSPIEPVIEWASPSPIAYGTPLSVLQLGAMETSDISGTFVYVPDHGTILDAGVHELQLTFFPDEEDRFLTVSLERSLEVQPGLLKIIAEDKEWEPGQVFPELTVLLEGFANGDGEADLETSFTLFTSAGPETPPGTYPIQASGAEAPNYSISFIDGLFTIPEINFSLWMSRFIEDDEGVIVVLDEADTSGDGVSDLLKYALDLDPRAADVSVMSDTVPGLPLLRRGEVDGIDHLFLAYRRNPVKTDLTYRVEFSDDLESWLPLIDPYDEIIGNDNGIEIREAGVPLDGNLKFLRLKVTRSDQESVGVR